MSATASRALGFGVFAKPSFLKSFFGLMFILIAAIWAPNAAAQKTLGGGPVTGYVGTTVRVAVVAEENGNNSTNIGINWSTNGGTLSATTSLTDASLGIAFVDLTLPATPGPITVIAERADAPGVTATNIVTVLKRVLNVSSGNNQTGTVGTTLPLGLLVAAIDDDGIDGVPANGVQITWTTTGGTLAATSLITGPPGTANNGLTLPATPGTITVTATRDDDPTAIATFTVTATAAVSQTIAVSSGNNQSGVSGAQLALPLVVLLQDNAVNTAGITVNWAASAGTFSSSSSVSDGTGLASVTFTLPTIGGSPPPPPQDISITATRADNGAVTNFTATVGVAPATIDAIDDTGFTTPAITSISTVVVDNDTATGGTINADSVTITIVPVNGTAVVSATGGTVSYTPKPGFVGVDTYTYQVCLTAPNAGVCDTAVVTITVTPTISAVNDTLGTIPSTGGNTTSVIANDTTNGVAAVIGTNVTLTANTFIVGLTLNTDGTITVAAGTTAQNYSYSYIICTLPATTPTATCSTASAAVTVGATPTINAVDDSGITTPAVTAVTTAVLDNDTSTGGTIDPASVVVDAASAPTNGTVSVSGLTGAITYAPNAGFAGVDSYTYRACLASPNPLVCDTALVTIIVTPTISAANDAQIVLPSIGGATSTVSVFDNDITNGVAVVLGTNATLLTSNVGGGLTFNANGTFTVPAGTVANTYNYDYTICTLPATNPTTCSTSNGTVLVTASTTSTLTLVSGDNQSGTVGTLLAQPLVVLAQNVGVNAPNITINWTTTGGTLSAASTVTGATGTTPINLTLPTTPGAVTVTGTRADNNQAIVTFTATATAAVVNTTLTISSGNNQTGQLPGTTLTAPLVVLAQNDGVNTTGIQINWTASAGILSAGTSGTDINGLSSINLALPANLAPGPITITATRADNSNAVAIFTATVSATPNRTLSVSSGNNQSGIIGTTLAQPLVALVQDNGVASPNNIVNWTTTGGTLNTNNSAADTLGLASVSLTLPGTPGTVTVTGRRADDNTVFTTFIATATTVAVTRTLTVSSGDNQSATVGSTLPQPLVMVARDNGFPVANITINWTTTGGTLSAASSLTGATGLANVNLTLPTTAGTVTVTGTRADDNTVFATFTATATAAIVNRTLAVSSGNNQRATLGNALLQPLVALAQDNGVNAPNITINWTTTGGTLSAASSITNAAGLASVGLTLPGGTPGTFTVTGTRADNNQAVATFTATGVTSNVLIVSGNNQSGTVGSVLTLPLVVKAEDNAIGVAGATITWTTSGGTLSAPNSVTDQAGNASVTLTLPANAGPVTVTATRAFAGSVTFTATATAAAVTRALTIVSGNGQAAAPGSTLAAPLIVLATNNGVAANAIGINWTISTGSTLGAANNISNATGQASNTVTLGATTGTVTITATRQDDPTATATFAVNNVVLGGIPNLTPGQAATAAALDNACGQASNNPNPTPSELDFIQRCRDLANNAATNPAAVRVALQELLPDTQVAQSNTTLATVSRQFEIISSRIATLRAGAKGTSLDGFTLNGANGGSISLGSLVNGLSADTTPATEVGGDFQRWGFFLSGSIGRGKSDATTFAPRYSFDLNSLTAGLDYRYNDNLIFGAALGYNQQDTNLSLGQGGVDAKAYTLSAYGSYFRNDNWYTDASLTFGRNNYALVRQITYTIGSNTVNQTARADSDGDQFSFGITFGRDYQKAGWNIGPYGRVLYSKLNFDRIQESLVSADPGTGLALIIEERGLDSLASVIGTKFIRSVSMDWGVLTPNLQIEWEHEFKSDTGAAVARFVNDPSGTTIILKDAPTDGDYFRIGLGLSAIMSKGRSGFIYYDRVIGRQGITQDNLTLGLRIEF